MPDRPRATGAEDQGSARAEGGWRHDRLARSALVVVVVLGAWALAWLTFRVLSNARLVVVPLVLAVFPALVLTPVVRWLKVRGVPPAAAALATIVATLAVLGATFAAVGRAVVDQFDDLGDQLESATRSSGPG